MAAAEEIYMPLNGHNHDYQEGMYTVAQTIIHIPFRLLETRETVSIQQQETWQTESTTNHIKMQTYLKSHTP